MATVEPPGAKILWTPDRKRLSELLADLHRDAAELYVSIINAFAQQPLSRPRLMIGSHCVRELVPVLLELQGLDTPARANDSRAIRELASAWKRYELRLEPSPDEQEFAPDQLRAVPSAVYQAARDAAAIGDQGGNNAKTKAALLALGQADEFETAAIRRLHNAIERFAKWTHRRDYTKPMSTLPAMSEVERNLRVIEEALLTRLANRGDRVAALQKILAGINRRREDV